MAVTRGGGGSSRRRLEDIAFDSSQRKLTNKMARDAGLPKHYLQSEFGTPQNAQQERARALRSGRATQARVNAGFRSRKGLPNAPEQQRYLAAIERRLKKQAR